jgi:hypothetical protein
MHHLQLAVAFGGPVDLFVAFSDRIVIVGSQPVFRARLP